MRLAVVHVDVVRPHDVGVVELGGGAGFDAEPLQVGRVLDAIGRQHLDGHLALHERVLGEVHLAHAALAQVPQQLVLAEHEALVLAGQQLFGLPLGEQVRRDHLGGQLLGRLRRLATVARGEAAEELRQLVFFDQLAPPHEIKEFADGHRR